MTIFAHGLGLPRRSCHFLLAFFALFPLFPVMFSSLAKDTISVLFFIPFSMMYIRAIRTKGKSLEKAGNIALLLFLTVLTCLTKKPMVYIVAPSLVVLIFTHVSKRAKVASLIIGLTAGALIMLVIPKIVLPALNIEPGGKQESIPFAIQEVAHDVKYNGDTLSEGDKEVISKFLTIKYNDISGAYSWQLADPVKGTSLKDPRFSDRSSSFTAWAVVNRPMGHIESFIGLTQGWFSFVTADGGPNLSHCHHGIRRHTMIRSVNSYQWPVEAAHGGAVRSIYSAIQSIPVVNFLFYRSTWASILPCFVLYLLCSNENRGNRVQIFFSTLPIAMTCLYLMLVPVSTWGGEPTRYVLQSVCTLPLFFAYVLSVHGARIPKGVLAANELDCKKSHPPFSLS